MGLLKEFKEFAMRGSVVDLAVGVVIGAAFGKIVTTFVSSIITPIIGFLTGGIDVKDWKYKMTLPEGIVLPEGMKPPTIAYGEFLQVLIDFTIIAFAIFMAIKVMNSLTKTKETAPEAPPAPPEDILLLREIRDSLKAR